MTTLYRGAGGGLHTSPQTMYQRASSLFPGFGTGAFRFPRHLSADQQRFLAQNPDILSEMRGLEGFRELNIRNAQEQRGGTVNIPQRPRDPAFDGVPNAPQSGGMFRGRPYDATRFRAQDDSMKAFSNASGHYTNRDFNRDLAKRLRATYPDLDIAAWRADNERAARSGNTYRGLSLPQFYAQQKQEEAAKQRQLLSASMAAHQLALQRASRDGKTSDPSYNLRPPPPGNNAIGATATAIVDGQTVRVVWNGRSWERMDISADEQRARAMR